MRQWKTESGKWKVVVLICVSIAFHFPLSTFHSIAAQDSSRVTLCIDNLHFFVDNEYAATRVDGYTLPGFVLRPRVEWRIEERVKIEAGVHWLHYWGAHGFPADQSLEGRNSYSGDATRIHVLPWLQARVELTPWLSAVFGSLENNDGHQLPLPLYNPERQYAADPEGGVQLIVDHHAVQADLWVDWRDFIWNYSPTQERFCAGLSARGRLHLSDRLELYLPLHAVLLHNGGEGVTDTTIPVRSRFNGAAGLGMSAAIGGFNLAAEGYLMGYFNNRGENSTPVRDNEGYMVSPGLDFRTGWGFYPVLKAGYKGWRMEASYWQGEQFVPLLGCYHYSNISSNTPDMTHDMIRVLTVRGGYTYHGLKHCTLSTEVSYYHYFPYTGDRTGYLKVIRSASEHVSVGFFLHLHPRIKLGVRN